MLPLIANCNLKKLLINESYKKDKTKRAGPASLCKAGTVLPVFEKTRLSYSAVITSKHRAQEIDRETALQTSQNEATDRIPFILIYHPQNLAIKNVILKNFEIVCNDRETKHIFSLPPLISFKRDKNLILS